MIYFANKLGITYITDFKKKYKIIIGNHKKANKYIKNVNDEDEDIIKAKVVINNNLDYIPKVSVIIPFHNKKKYINECIETIINQTLKEIEIICIDNGSTDDSLDVLKKYAEVDERITVIKQNIQNCGNAKNIGLSFAKGNYLSFLDSDYSFDLNMLEEMYEELIKQQVDIIICPFKIFNVDDGIFKKPTVIETLRFDFLPKNNFFSINDISKNIFQFCSEWTLDKMFRTSFIKSNKIQFLNIEKFNDYHFTFLALCSAKSIIATKKIILIKKVEPILSKSIDPNIISSCLITSVNNLKANLKRTGFFFLVKESFWKWVNIFCTIQIKYLDKDSKEYIFNNLLEKLNLHDFIDESFQSINIYRALHYIKHQKVFPTINISYLINRNHLNLFLVSLVSLLKNSGFENINIILLYKNITQIELEKINYLKEIRPFTLLTLNVTDTQFIEFSSKECENEEYWLYNINHLFNKYSSLFDVDKILYLNYNTIIRKSLISLWEIKMKNYLFAFFESDSFKIQKRKNISVDDFFCINYRILLLTIKKWGKIKMNNKIISIIKDHKNVYELNKDIVNIFTNSKKFLSSLELNYDKLELKNTSPLFYNEYIREHEKNDSTFFYFSKDILDMNFNNTILKTEYLKYYSILNNLTNMCINIPIVLSADDEYAPYMYTSMVSILENRYKNTYYSFYLLVPYNFSKNIESLILDITNKYICSIYFIHIERLFENLIMKIRHITLPTYYRLLIGDLLPIEMSKCIYLDVDICVNKDLSELFNIDMNNNYIAGVVAAGYYFSEKYNCLRLNLTSMKQYVNAGMLVLNLNQIRKDNMTRKFIELSKRNYDSQDQDVLNVACYGKIITLPPKFNAMVFRLKENNPLLRDLYKEEDIIEANIEPYIIHYADKNKPWNSIEVYMEKYWWNIAKKTPYIKDRFTRINIYKNYLKIFWYNKTKKVLDFEIPRSFNEKIQWLNLYDSTPIKTRLTDKFLVREWVKEKIGKEYLIPLIGVYDKFDDINFETLPIKFVIKCNHGSNYNIIVKNKSQLNLTNAKSLIEKWMYENNAFYYDLKLEYRDIIHKIIIEEYMDEGTGDLREYKFICFSGVPYFILVDSDRHSYHKRSLYDLNWNQLSYHINSNYSIFPFPKKPKYLEKMIELTSILCKGFVYVIVNFYFIKEKIYFGEMSFTCSAGTEDIIPKNFERKLSLLVRLPKKVYNIDTGEYYKLSKHLPLYPLYIFLLSFLMKLTINNKEIFKLFFC